MAWNLVETWHCVFCGVLFLVFMHLLRATQTLHHSVHNGLFSHRLVLKGLRKSMLITYDTAMEEKGKEQ